MFTHTLELRKIYRPTDLFMCYKTAFGVVELEFVDFFFTFDTNISIRGHPYKLLCTITV